MEIPNSEFRIPTYFAFLLDNPSPRIYLISKTDRPVSQFQEFVLITTAVRPTDKRERLVKAAAEVFAAKGYAGTRVADIAERAEVGKGTVYEYFSSKEELLFAVFESVNQHIAARLDTALAEGGSAREQLSRLLEIGVDVVHEQQDLQPVVLDFWAASRGKDFEAHYRESVVASYVFFRKVVSDFIRTGQDRSEFRRDVDVEALATTVVATIDGIGVQHYFDRSVDPGRTIEALGLMLIELLKPEST